ncbi:MAG: CopG family antitoxin [Patescibacteria group bacterium]
MKKKLKKIPKFKNEDEEAKFWLKADSTEYIDWSKAEHVTDFRKWMAERIKKQNLKTKLR